MFARQDETIDQGVSGLLSGVTEGPAGHALRGGPGCFGPQRAPLRFFLTLLVGPRVGAPSICVTPLGLLTLLVHSLHLFIQKKDT